MTGRSDNYPDAEQDVRLPLWLAVVLGAALAVILSRLWTLEARWLVVTVVGIAMVAVTMMFVGHLQRFLFPMLLLSMPLASIEKWLFFGQVASEDAGNAVYSGAIGIGLIDFVIVGLAGAWFIEVFVTRESRLPRLEFIDALALLVPVVYLVSLIDTPRPILGIFSAVYVLKHVFVYFYVSRHVERRHLTIILYAVLAILLMETLLAVLQTQFHVLEGLARDKGAGLTERKAQYEVPGIEARTRAEGSAYDSHAFGLYLCMLLPMPLLLVFDDRQSMPRRFVYSVVALAGVSALVLSFSRAAWLSFALSMLMAVSLLGLRLKVRDVMQSVLFMMIPLALAAPWGLGFIHERFSSAPVEIMTTRFEQWEVAWSIWLDNFFLGYGAGNYMEALASYNFNWALELPVHNVPLWICAETGVVGLISFFGLFLAAVVRLWRVTKSSDRGLALSALAGLTALTAYFLDGLTDPLYREPVVFMTFWFIVALSVALTRLNTVPSLSAETTPRL